MISRFNSSRAHHTSAVPFYNSIVYTYFMHLIRFLFFLFSVSLVLHFGWEISQMSLYVFSGVTSAGYLEFVTLHWITAAKDALITVALYLIVGMLVGNIGWGRRFNYRRSLFLFVLGFLWAVGIEYHAVAVAHRWAYVAAMPLLPALGVGVAPVLQMMIVPFVGIWLTRKQLSEK